MSDSDLPYIYAVIQCGHCGSELETDGGSWTCYSCGIYWETSNPYDADGSQAIFLDEEQEPCGAEATMSPREHHGKRFWDAPCTLPAGHRSEHYHPLAYESLEPEEPIT